MSTFIDLSDIYDVSFGQLFIICLLFSFHSGSLIRTQICLDERSILPLIQLVEESDL